MAQNPKPSRSKHIGDNEVQEITNASNRALTALFDKLNSVLAGPEGKFFPNGIELIAFDITVGEKSNPAVSISVKVAGAAGVKGTALIPGDGDSALP